MEKKNLFELVEGKKLPLYVSDGNNVFKINKLCSTKEQYLKDIGCPVICKAELGILTQTFTIYFSQVYCVILFKHAIKRTWQLVEFKNHRVIF